MTRKSPKNKAFTLLELLIVIAIIAILSVALVIVLNPSESLKKSRDAQRMSDLATIKKAIGIYLTTTPSPIMAGVSNTGCKGTTSDTVWQPATDHIYYSYPSDTAVITATTIDGTTFTTGGPVQVSKANLNLNNGNGWLPINFSTISGGSPISHIPVDPINTIANPAAPTNTDLVYRYICSEKDLTYKIASTLESTAFTVTDNKMMKDGGNNDLYYETGTNLTLFTSEISAPTYALRATGPGGGLVFYISDGGLHGLEAATTDQSTSIAWITGGSTQSTLNGNTLTAVGIGQANTNFMIAQSGYTGGAAKIVDDLVSGGKSDWFLPSKDELNLMYTNLKLSGVGGFAVSDYWSSSENAPDSTWFESFSNGNQYYYGKGFAVHVRAVRAF